MAEEVDDSPADVSARHTITWTPTMLDDLRKLSANQLKLKYNISLYRLQEKLRGLGLPSFAKRNQKRYAKFTPEMIGLLGKRSDRYLAQTFKLTYAQVAKKRRRLGIPSYKKTFIDNAGWSPDAIKLLGTMRDGELAKKVGLPTKNVTAKRSQFGIPCFKVGFQWTAENDALLGTASDPVIAKRLGIDHIRVWKRRTKLGIPAPRTLRTAALWSEEIKKLLGTMSDSAFGRKFGMKQGYVSAMRRKLGIPVFKPTLKQGGRKLAAVKERQKLEIPACSHPNKTPSVQACGTATAVAPNEINTQPKRKLPEMTKAIEQAPTDLHAVRQACLLVHASTPGYAALTEIVAEAAKHADFDTPLDQLANDIGRAVLVKLCEEARRHAPQGVYVSFVRKTS